MSDTPFIVLMAEDDDVDVMTTERAWRKHNILNTLRVVRDGEECLDYLYRRGDYADAEGAPRPGILLLDINMPKLDGLGVLKQLRGSDHSYLRTLPVIMLTSSKADQDRLGSYDLGANAYIVKPVGFENFAEAVNTINLFWQLVALPCP